MIPWAHDLVGITSYCIMQSLSCLGSVTAHESAITIPSTAERSPKVRPWNSFPEWMMDLARLNHHSGQDSSWSDYSAIRPLNVLAEKLRGIPRSLGGHPSCYKNLRYELYGER